MTESVLGLVCCIYHRPKAFDESSSESQSSSDEDDASGKKGAESRRGMQKLRDDHTASGGETAEEGVESRLQGGSGNGDAR